MDKLKNNLEDYKSLLIVANNYVSAKEDLEKFEAAYPNDSSRKWEKKFNARTLAYDVLSETLEIINKKYPPVSAAAMNANSEAVQALCEEIECAEINLKGIKDLMWSKQDRKLLEYIRGIDAVVFKLRKAHQALATYGREG